MKNSKLLMDMSAAHQVSSLVETGSSVSLSVATLGDG
jgi:hypothetical protein